MMKYLNLDFKMCRKNTQTSFKLAINAANISANVFGGKNIGCIFNLIACLLDKLRL
jgi:hypothetical protein